MKIVFTGPESSGKTTMANWSSDLSGMCLVKEVAREYMEILEVPYDGSHVREIGLLQQFDENLRSSQHRDIICDTDLLTIIIWLEVKYKISDHHFPWVDDPLRENPHNRNELLTIYQNYLIQYKKPFVPLSGNIQNRQQLVHQTILNLTGKDFGLNS